MKNPFLWIIALSAVVGVGLVVSSSLQKPDGSVAEQPQQEAQQPIDAAEDDGLDAALAELEAIPQ